MSLTNAVEVAFTFSLFANALFCVPQIITLIKQKNSEAISLFTFIGFNIVQLFTIWHGFLVKDYKLMFGVLLSFVTCFVLVALTIRYRFNK